MKTVRVRAVNLRRGDILDGRRIRDIHHYGKRVRATNAHVLASTGVLIIAPNPSGNKLDTIDLRGDKFVKVKRPNYNMKYRRKRRNNNANQTH